MSSLGATLGAAVIAYAATNIDDFAVLVVFYSRVIAQQPSAVSADATASSVSLSQDLRHHHVWMGQGLGFTVICVVSLLGLVLGAFVPPGYLALIGFVPLLMGFYKLVELIRDHFSNTSDTENDQPQDANHAEYTQAQQKDEAEVKSESQAKTEPQVQSQPEVKIEMQVQSEPQVQSESQIQSELQVQSEPRQDKSESEVQQSEKQVQSEPESAAVDTPEEDNDADDSALARAFRYLFQRCLHPFALEVAAVTIANGGDNIGIYLPLFATVTPLNLVATLVVFYIMLALWCIVAFLLLRCSAVASVLSKYGEIIVPFLLMGLGLYVLSGSVLFNR